MTSIFTPIHQVEPSALTGPQSFLDKLKVALIRIAFFE